MIAAGIIVFTEVALVLLCVFIKYYRKRRRRNRRNSGNEEPTKTDQYVLDTTHA